jgi:CHAT domain-containing protein
MENKKDQNIKFTRKEMEENLPDYIFERLSPENVRKFEQTLPEHPDLIDEIKQVKAIFDKLEKIDYDKIVFDKIKDLPTRVNSRLSKRTYPQSLYTPKGKYLIPSLAAAVIFALALPNFLTKDVKNLNLKTTNVIENQQIQPSNQNNIANNNSYEVKILKQTISEKNKIINNKKIDLAKSKDTNNDLISHTIILPTQTLMSLSDEEIPYVEEFINTQYNNFMGYVPVQSFQNSIIRTQAYEPPINSYIETLDNKDLELIIKEVQNVNYQS